MMEMLSPGVTDRKFGDCVSKGFPLVPRRKKTTKTWLLRRTHYFFLQETLTVLVHLPVSSWNLEGKSWVRDPQRQNHE
jgi:hypothetical protein